MEPARQRDEQIQKTVVVVVPELGERGVRGSAGTRDGGESAAAVAQGEHAGTRAAEEEVDETVLVDVGRGNSRDAALVPGASAAQVNVRAGIVKGAVAHVPEEARGHAAGREEQV